MRKILLVIGAFVVFQTASANDSIKIFSLEEYLQVIKKYHPVARQSNLQIDKAKASLTVARGSFDPLLSSNGSNKTFDGQNYYQHTNTQLSIPTWYGIELQGGIEYLGGTKTDPQETTGKTSFAGISIPIAKNLLMDKRRAALQQAKIMLQASEQERRNMLNDLMMEAIAAYWQWVEYYFVFKTYNDVIELNNKRVGLVKAAYQIGERPAIDTTEAIAQLQQFEYLRNEAMLNWQNAQLLLNTFLWKENNQLVELPHLVVPDKKIEVLPDEVSFPQLETMLGDSKKNHPQLSMYDFKLKMLDVDKKLKFQELLPKVDLKYNLLGKGYQLTPMLTQALFDNNYKAGFSISVPLRLSQGRGEYKQAKLKITEMKYEQSLKETVVHNKIRMYYNELVNYKTQVNLLQRSYTNYQRLQQGEETRFFAGESSLFLLNSRENKTLETRIKFIETVIKFSKANYSLKWAAGELWKL